MAAIGVRRLGRKRYAETVRYLKQVIADASKPDRLRMQAVETLLEVYRRNDASEKARLSREEAVTAPETPDRKEETVEEFLARMKGVSASAQR